RAAARVKQRLDGFVSLDAVGEPGTATTRPLVFAGDRLVLNVAAQGAVRVGLLDEQGRAVPGFAASDCDPLQTDSTGATVTWHGRSDVRALAGKVVRVRFELREAKLFAFQFINGAPHEEGTDSTTRSR